MNIIKNLSNRNNKNCNEIKETKTYKDNKEERLLDEGFKLFTTKGLKNTSIQDIVNKANVAKGTFYLYFKDKYELHDILIMKKSKKLFNDALNSLNKNKVTDFVDQIIYIVDYVIDELVKDPILIQFIAKDLAWGVFNKTILELYSREEAEEDGLVSLFLTGVEENNIKLDNPQVSLFMIIELVSSTCFTSILYSEPLPIKEYKPFLHKEIKKILQN
ncbi:regulatory protein TetR [Clostridium sp. CAG:793]|jgi:hypothetical protein|nr:regulatory protein TetR [Clostridium sp. CAG:793]